MTETERDEIIANIEIFPTINTVEELLSEISKANRKIEELTEDIGKVQMMFIDKNLSDSLSSKLIKINDELSDQLWTQKEWLQTLYKGKVSYE